MPLEFLDTDIQAIAEAPFYLRPNRGISFSGKSCHITLCEARLNIALTLCLRLQINEGILASGAIGGSITAIRLMKGITEFLLPSSLGEDFEVMVDIYIESDASLDHSNCEEGAISNNRFSEFVQGFNNALPMFNISVVGRDSKEKFRKIEGLTFLI